MSPRGDPRQEPIKNSFPGLKKQLEEEYRGLPESKIDEVARQALGEFDGARVREFVPILAWRRARKQLRKATQANLRERLDALGPAPRAELLHVLMLPDFDRADRIGEFWGYPQSRTFAELLIDCQEDRTLRAVLVGMLREGERGR